MKLQLLVQVCTLSAGIMALPSTLLLYLLLLCRWPCRKNNVHATDGDKDNCELRVNATQNCNSSESNNCEKKKSERKRTKTSTLELFATFFYVTSVLLIVGVKSTLFTPAF